MKFSIVACRVFEDELAHYLPSLTEQPLQVQYFDVSLHIVPDAMREKLNELISNADERSEAVLLMCGLCGNATLGLKSDKFTLVIPRMHECLSMFLGSTEKYLQLKKERPHCYFASRGWMKSGLMPGRELYDKMKAEYMAKYDGDEELVGELMDAFMEQYRAYDSYLYSDFLHSEEGEKQCKCNADFMKWSFESSAGDKSFFCDAISQKWDERFLILKPGDAIRATYDEKIFDV